MDKFTKFVETKNAVGFKEAFRDAVAEKVSATLDIYKASIAQTMFNSEVNEDAGFTGLNVKGHTKIPKPLPKKAIVLKSKEVSEEVVDEEVEEVDESKIELTRQGRATPASIRDIVAKNNARLAKKKADAEKAEKKKNQ